MSCQSMDLLLLLLLLLVLLLFSALLPLISVPWGTLPLPAWQSGNILLVWRQAPLPVCQQTVCSLDEAHPQSQATGRAGDSTSCNMDAQGAT